MKFLKILTFALVIPTSACGATEARSQEEPIMLPAHIQSALDAPSRPRGDRRRDEDRRPGDILAVAGLQPGMSVLEMEAGGGYFSHILSLAVGDDGRVDIQNPAKLDAFFGTELSKRVQRLDLSNVRIHTEDFDDLRLESGSVDLVTWIQGPHEVWFSPQADVSLGDPAKTFSEIARVLKPGGTLLVSDHVAPAGSGASAGNALHRIDPDFVDGFVRRSGLVDPVRYSFLLLADDDPARPSWDRRVKGRTSQFVIVYRKPEEK